MGTRAEDYFCGMGVVVVETRGKGFEKGGTTWSISLWRWYAVKVCVNNPWTLRPRIGEFEGEECDLSFYSFYSFTDLTPSDSTVCPCDSWVSPLTSHGRDYDVDLH